MESSLRGPLIVLEIAALGAILALVEDTFVRVAMGLVVGALLARSALPVAAAQQGPPTGLPERRQDHLFRHWLTALVKKAREFHIICQGIKTGQVNLSMGQLKVQQIQSELEKLLNQMTDTSKPDQLKRTQHRRPHGSHGGTFEADMTGYGEKRVD